MTSDFSISLRRTFVPILVGVIGATAIAGDIDPDALEKVIGGLISGIYYTVFRAIEIKFPAVGIMLGAKKQPVYFAPDEL